MPFDKIYCLHLADAHSRYLTSQYAFEKVGILDQVEYWWTVKRPFISKCIDKFPNLKNWYYDCYIDKKPSVYNNVFNCAYEHYTMIKQSYIRGFESIMIFEDDIYIHVDKENFENVMNSIPKDYDVIQFFDTFRWDWNQFNNVFFGENKGITSFIKLDTGKMKLSTIAYALSRRAMKEIIDMYDKFGLLIADKIFEKIDTSKLNYYVPEYIMMSPINNNDDNSNIVVQL